MIYLTTLYLRTQYVALLGFKNNTEYVRLYVTLRN